jgi:hypothetical protein
VTAPMTATCSTPEMVRRREYHHSVLVDIVVFFVVSQRRTLQFFPDFVHHRHRIIQFAGKPSRLFETKPAQTCRFQTICGQSAEDLTRHDDLLAPARSLVKMTFSHPAPVITAAQRASFVLIQTLQLDRGKRRLLVKAVCFHDLSRDAKSKARKVFFTFESTLVSSVQFNSRWSAPPEIALYRSSYGHNLLPPARADRLHSSPAHRRER